MCIHCITKSVMGFATVFHPIVVGRRSSQCFGMYTNVVGPTISQCWGHRLGNSATDPNLQSIDCKCSETRLTRPRVTRKLA